MALTIITRAEAKARGLKRWASGEPCKQGHVAERSTLTGGCVACQSARARKHYEANRDKIIQRAAAYYEANRDATSSRDKAYREANKDKIRLTKVRYSEKNRETIAARVKAYQKANEDKIRNAYKLWYAANAGKIRARQKAYREANAGKLRSQKKAYREANTGKLRSQQKAYREANRDKIDARIKAWIEQNPDARKEHRLAGDAARRARKYNQAGVVSRGIRAKLRKLQNGKCVYCRVTLKVVGEHLDHVVPLALGGLHDDANLQLLCPRCNMSKKAKHPDDFARELGLLL